MPAPYLSPFALRKRVRIVSLVAAALLVVVGGLVLLGWAADVEALKRLAPGLVSMKANAAVAFLLAGAALVLRSSDSGRARTAGFVPATLLVLLGSVTLAEYVAGWDAGIDQLFFLETDPDPHTSHPGRMAPNGAFCFLLAGVALALAASARDRLHRAGEILAFVVGVVAFQAVVGYAFGVEVFYAVPDLTQMALHTAVGLVVLTVGILFVAPGRGYMSVVVDPGGAGVAARGLLPIAVTMPFLLGLFVVAGARAGFYGDRLGISILVSLLTLFILAAVGWTAGEIREVDRERRSLLESEKEARARLERTIREREELMSVVSHDLRNPLNAISATASLLLEQVIPPGDAPRHLETIKRSANTMERLIQDLLDVSRIEGGRLSVDRRPSDVTRILREACEELDLVAREKGVTLRCQVEALPPGRVDPDRLRQVVANLVGNAFRFTPEGGTVTVRAVEARGEARVTVSDTGAGIPLSDLPHLFEPFWQGEGEKSQGAGLGLAIVKGLVEAHGGRVWATSQPGSGASFHFTLPTEEADGPEPAAPKVARRAPGPRRDASRVEG